jgi:hypothetical protein
MLQILSLTMFEKIALDQLLGRIRVLAVGPQQGRKVFTLQTLPGSTRPINGFVGLHK